MKQVWQTSDGEVFDTEAEAKEWEDQELAVKNLSDWLYKNTYGCSTDICNEVAREMVENFIITPK